MLCAGLINQQYSHIAAFTLAAVLGAEIVLPPAAKRDSFAHYFSVFKEQVSRCQLLQGRHSARLWLTLCYECFNTCCIRAPDRKELVSTVSKAAACFV